MVRTIPPYRERPVIKRRSNGWAIGFILLFFVSSLVLLFFQSPWSKIRDIEINGNETLHDSDIRQQISLSSGVQFFQWDHLIARETLQDNPQIKEVDIAKIFPSKVRIDIVEWPRVALLQWDEEGEKLYPVLANGIVLDEPWQGVVDRPLLRGWDDNAKVGQISEELNQVKPDILRLLSEIQPQPSSTYDDQVRVFTDDGNEIRTRISGFHKAINHYRQYVQPDQKGIIHMTYSEDFGWFEPYKTEEPDASQKPQKDPD